MGLFSLVGMVVGAMIGGGAFNQFIEVLQRPLHPHGVPHGAPFRLCKEGERGFNVVK
jgi:hypothetical protein